MKIELIEENGLFGILEDDKLCVPIVWPTKEGAIYERVF